MSKNLLEQPSLKKNISEEKKEAEQVVVKKK